MSYNRSHKRMAAYAADFRMQEFFWEDEKNDEREFPLRNGGFFGTDRTSTKNF